TLSHLNGTITIPPEFIEESRTKTDQAVEIAQISLAVIIGGSIIGTIALGASSTIWAFVSFQQFIGYFIYINIHYPSQVEVFLSMLQSSFWDHLPNPLSYITEPLLENFFENNNI